MVDSPPQTKPKRAPPAGGGPPAAPPAIGEPPRGDRPDPRDPGPPIGVVLAGVPLGDLGNARVDSRLVMAVVLRGGEVARWLRARGVTASALSTAFAGWPLSPPYDWPSGIPDPADPELTLPVSLDRLVLGDLGEPSSDADLLWAIALRDCRVAAWLREHGVDAVALGRAFPGTGWELS